jgi:hypothetical protein
MPWRCPACRSEIWRSPIEATPDATVDYRCHVCRLDLRFDPATQKMFIAPFQTEQPINPPETRRQVTLIPFPTKPRNE